MGRRGHLLLLCSAFFTSWGAFVVSDIATAAEFYIKKLGFQLAFTWGEPPTFAGANLGKVQMFLAKGTPTPSPDTGAVYFLVGDADQLYEIHRANAVEIAQAIDDRPYGIRPHSYIPGFADFTAQ